MKRQREQDLKDKARKKEARRAERAAQRSDNTTSGPAIAWDEQVRAVDTVDVQQGSLVPTDDSAD